LLVVQVVLVELVTLLRGEISQGFVGRGSVTDDGLVVSQFVG
jgi:hypothetical protein